MFVLVRPEPRGVKFFDTRFGVMLFIGGTLNPDVVSKVYLYDTPKQAAERGTKRFGEGAWSVMQCDWVSPDSLTPRRIVATFNSHKKDAGWRKLTGR